METNQIPLPKWYHYVATFFAGMFLANALPHYIQGISGHAFPSPFGHPPGFGKSSPTSNVLWGAFNLMVGYLLFRVGRIDKNNKISLLLLYMGIVAQGVMLSLAFSQNLK